MSPRLQQILQDLDQLSPSDQWQVVEHLIRQLRRVLSNPVAVPSPPPSLSPQAILTCTRGSWGQKNRDQIDARLAQQRKQDWGE